MNAIVTQSAYSENIAVGLAGLIVNMREYDAITRTCEPATLAFGVACKQGTDRVHGTTVGGIIADFLGVTIRDITLVQSATANVDKYEVGNNVGILTTGEIWVQVSVDVTPDDPVHYSATTGVFAISGGTGPIVGARWTSNSVSGLCRLHLPNHGQAA
jgi:hypothetical protein